MVVKLIFDGSNTPPGYGSEEYAGGGGEVVETTEDSLTEVFREAAESGESLSGARGDFDDAMSDPLEYRDYLMLSDGEIVFNKDHSRRGKEIG